jgi:hypothetical protein
MLRSEVLVGVNRFHQLCSSIYVGQFQAAKERCGKINKKYKGLTVCDFPGLTVVILLDYPNTLWPPISVILLLQGS